MDNILTTMNYHCIIKKNASSGKNWIFRNTRYCVHDLYSQDSLIYDILKNIYQKDNFRFMIFSKTLANKRQGVRITCT